MWFLLIIVAALALGRRSSGGSSAGPIGWDAGGISGPFSVTDPVTTMPPLVFPPVIEGPVMSSSGSGGWSGTGNIVAADGGTGTGPIRGGGGL